MAAPPPRSLACRAALVLVGEVQQVGRRRHVQRWVGEVVPDEAPCQRRLARAEVSLQEDDVAALGLGGQGGAESLRRCPPPRSLNPMCGTQWAVKLSEGWRRRREADRPGRPIRRPARPLPRPCPLP